MSLRPSHLFNPPSLADPAGMLCALTAAAFWLLFATYAELPVSTTHSISE